MIGVGDDIDARNPRGIDVRPTGYQQLRQLEWRRSKQACERGKWNSWDNNNA